MAAVATTTATTAATPPLPPRSVEPKTPVIKDEAIPAVIASSPTNALPSPTKVSLPPLPPSTLVGNWILTGHVFAPQRDYFIEISTLLARRRVVDHLMVFKFPDPTHEPIPVHYSRLALAGGPMADLLHETKKEDVDIIDKETEKKANEDVPMDPAPDSPNKENKVDNEIAVDTIANETPSTPPPTADAVNATEPNETNVQRTPESPPRKAPVLLNPHDTPRTFGIIVKFLYCEKIEFNYLTFQEIVFLATAAHRWSLTDLYHATFAYVMDQNLLAGGLGIRTFIPLVSHAETPEAFRRYFCIAVGHHFDVLYPRLKALAITEENAPLHLVVPPLWDVIIRQNMFSHALHCISLYSKASYDTYLLDVALRYYEPTKENDDDVLGILSQLNWDEIDPSTVFESGGLCRNWSVRAVRLAALASYAPQTEALEVRIPWNIPLQRLLRQETWSFQTEHVLCGPYVCYLHVRKGDGPEVSLFVHIWYRDGKPIGADARHESVRVKCRATERNCHCDSGRQWSYSMHGFLENLKFEGKLEGYPGLGWSQFLEERRLEEWRNCHGENCGLAITTVLQFMRPKRQFEGPASRSRSLRAPSPGRVQSPITKKHHGARSANRMKLRDAR